MTYMRWAVLAVSLCTTSLPSLASAQDAPAPAPAPPAPPASATTVAQTEPAESSAPAAPAPAESIEAKATPPDATVPAPAPPDEAYTKPISASAWGRISNVIQGSDPEKLNDVSQDVEVDLILGGRIEKHVGWQANFVGTYGPKPEVDENGMPTGKLTGDITGSVAILDLIGQIEVNDYFNVWVGRMLVPSDRSNFSGAWFMAPWAYPGFYQAFSAPAGPRQGPFGRNDGATVWGQTGGGQLKYYAGAFDLFDPSQSPLWSGRLNLALLSPEPGYYHSSSYYGKDILAVGVGGQYKKNGSIGLMSTDDYAEVNVDVLYEKVLPGKGVIDLEGAFYLFGGENEVLDNHFYAMASYLFPEKLGIGKLQPLVRFQGATPSAGGDMWTIYEAQAGYIISPYAARLAMLFQRTDVEGAVSNALILGVQLQK